MSQYEDDNIQVVDCNGNGTLFGTLPGNGDPLVEKYMAIAPAESAGAGFTPGDLFVTKREQIYVAHPPSGTFTLFADLSLVLGGCPLSDHSAITFDKVGGPSGFGFNMIVTCENGRVWQVNNVGVATLIGNTTDLTHSTHIEGPAVLPSSFGPLGSQIMVADDINSNVYTINNMGVVNYEPFPGATGLVTGAEQILVIPQFPCTYCADRTFFQATAVNDQINSYPLSDFTGLGGDILITTEAGSPGTLRVHFNMHYHESMRALSSILPPS